MPSPASEPIPPSAGTPGYLEQPLKATANARLGDTKESFSLLMSKPRDCRGMVGRRISFDRRPIVLWGDSSTSASFKEKRRAIEANPPPNLSVRFEPQGSSSGGEYRIVAGSVAYRITVDAVTGRVRSVRE